MHDILLIAEESIGKVIEKYLQRENISITTVPDITACRFDGLEYRLVIFDISECGDDIAPTVMELHRRSRCSSFILIASMEQASVDLTPCIERMDCHITFIVKPIKLARLSDAVRTELQILEGV